MSDDKVYIKKVTIEYKDPERVAHMAEGHRLDFSYSDTKNPDVIQSSNIFINYNAVKRDSVFEYVIGSIQQSLNWKYAENMVFISEKEFIYMQRKIKEFEEFKKRIEDK